ncbi:MAG: transglutaminase N-terminal domain-containing protein [Vicinamibacterales bacterium]
MTGEVLYRVEHETRYAHGDRATTSQHLACLKPRSLDHQRVRRHELLVDPRPDTIEERRDFFGNHVHYFEILSPYAELTVLSRTLVSLRARAAVDPARSIPWDQVRESSRFRAGVPADVDAQFVFGSPYVAVGPEARAFAGPSFPPGQPALAGAIDLMHRIHAEFRFDPGATTVATPVTRVLADRHGVCQDFAHLMIAALRAVGLPARYVSGYLLTDPPPGQPRLVGADASHAWVALCDPVCGWVDLDPTNDVLPDLGHITTAWGRDYGDVSPLRGVVLGGQQQRLHVGVSVLPVSTDLDAPVASP